MQTIFFLTRPLQKSKLTGDAIPVANPPFAQILPASSLFPRFFQVNATLIKISVFLGGFLFFSFFHVWRCLCHCS